MSVVTLQDLIASAQQFADMEQSTFISNNEWTALVNFGLRQYWNKINQLVQDYNIKEVYFPLQTNVSDYDLPEDFLALRGLDLALLPGTIPPPPTQVWVSLRPYDFKERSQYNYPWFTSVGGSYAVRYCIMSTFIRFLPVPVPEALVRLSYIPVVTPLVAMTDSFNGYNGWPEYVSAWAAWRALKREESPTGEIAAVIAEWEKTLTISARDRNKDIGDCVTDVYRRGLWGAW